MGPNSYTALGSGVEAGAKLRINPNGLLGCQGNGPAGYKVFHAQVLILQKIVSCSSKFGRCFEVGFLLRVWKEPRMVLTPMYGRGLIIANGVTEAYLLPLSHL